MATKEVKECDNCKSFKGVDTILIKVQTENAPELEDHAEFDSVLYDYTADLCLHCQKRLLNFIGRGVHPPGWTPDADTASKP